VLYSPDIDVHGRRVFGTLDWFHWLPEEIYVRQLERFPSDRLIFVLEMMLPFRRDRSSGRSRFNKLLMLSVALFGVPALRPPVFARPFLNAAIPLFSL